VKVRNKKSSEFWTERGVRQGCPMNPTLFNIYMINLEEEIEKRQGAIGKEKFWSIIYADDVVLLIQREEKLNEMLRGYKKFLERKGLSLSAEKIKNNGV